MPEQPLGKGRYLISREVSENNKNFFFIEANELSSRYSKLKSAYVLTNVLDYSDGQMYGEIHV